MDDPTTDPVETPARRKRGGGRAGNARRDTGVTISQLPWQIPNLLDAPTEPLSAEGVAAVDNGAMRILEEIGLEVLNERALGLYEQDGARVDWDLQRVYIDREKLMPRLSTVPSHFTMHSRNPERNRLVGKNAVNFTTVASAPNSSDMEGGRRTGNFEDYCNFLRLAQSYDVIDFFSGYRHHGFLGRCLNWF